MSAQIKMICLWDYNTFTGFATVSKNLVKHFKEHFGDKMEMDIVAVNYFGDDYNDGKNIRIISAKNKDIAKDDFGRYVFMRSLKDKEYDMVFILQDLGVIVPTIKLLKEIRDEKRLKKQTVFKSIFYFPVDFTLTPNLAMGLDFFDALVTFTEYGKSNVLRLSPKVKDKLHVIPHGNSNSDFYPLPDEEKKAFRKEYFGKNADKFIITNVNRNQSRKDIPTTIFGFMEYWEEYDKNAFLYLHMNPKDPMGWHLRTILAQTPLREGEHFMLPPEDDYSKGATVEKLNKIYNASDVYLSTSTGEGWGLTVTEAMGTKLPILVPDHTSIGEIINHGDRGYALKTLYPIVAMVDNVIRFQSDIFEIAEQLAYIKLQIANQNISHTNRVNAAYDFINTLDWGGISKKFIKIIRELQK